MLGIASAFSFLTIIGRSAAPSGRSSSWFGLVGAALGAVLGAVWLGVVEIWPLGLAAGMVVTADIVLTGALHVDGLADSADGLLPHADRDRRLAIMAKPDIGAFGTAAVVVVLVLRVLALAAIDANLALLVVLWATSRACAAVAVVVAPYARDTGLASDFQGRRLPTIVVSTVTVAAAAVGAGFGVGAVGVAAVATAVLVTVLTVAGAIRRIGGFTGDVLGASILLAETAGLVVAAGSW